MTKFILATLSAAALLFIGETYAFADQISVTVNGQTYQCSGNQPDYAYFCRCNLQTNDYYTIDYYRMDRITGANETYVRRLSDGTTQSKDLDTCNRNLFTFSVCR